MSVETIIALVVVGLLLIFCEVFIPGGILGTIGGVVLLGGIVAGFARDVNWGLGLLVAVMVLGSVGFYLWVKYFPRSRMGRQLILANDARTWQGYDATKQALLGKEGMAHSQLRPAGTAMIEGKRVDVVTQGELVDANSRVRVIKVEGNRVVVTEI
jgi:membrane-bound serine protease (ClpP class)